MKRFFVITLLPEMFDALQLGVVGRAISEKKISVSCINPRDFTTDTHHTVDDRPYGGGPGMVMLYAPLKAAIETARTLCAEHTPVIYLAPGHMPVTQSNVNHLAANHDDTIFIAGRYEGIDQRLIDQCVDMTLSVGDYVLSGGELPAMTLIDAIARQVPGVLGHADSATEDSFSPGRQGLLDHPHYTRPETIDGMTVPSTLLSGDHAAIAQYRARESLRITWQKRPNLVKRAVLTQAQQDLLKQIQEEEQST